MRSFQYINISLSTDSNYDNYNFIYYYPWPRILRSRSDFLLIEVNCGLMSIKIIGDSGTRRFSQCILSGYNLLDFLK